MNILICDDEPLTLRLVETLVVGMGHTATCVSTGTEALFILTSAHAPRMAILDWEMPGLSGIDVCQRVRQNLNLLDLYLLLLTSRRNSEDIVAGLEAGANDYVTKPFKHAEFRARINIGARMIGLQDEIKTLSGMLPICAWCKKIRDEKALWVKVEDYVASHSQAQFTHGICPDCRVKVIAESSNG